MKHFILFLIYTWTGCALALLLFGVNYFFCTHEGCEFTGVEIVLVRTMTWLCLGTLMFTSSMLMNVIYAVVTGASTIDRLKMKAANTWHDSTLEEMPLTNIFGIGPRWTWCLPVDPIFEDYDKLMGYATRQRLLRGDGRSQDTAEDEVQRIASRRRAGDAAWNFASPIEV